MKKLAAKIISPGGDYGVYEVVAENKTEGRKMLRRAYREETPPPSAGFYAFEECKVEWIEDED